MINSLENIAQKNPYLKVATLGPLAIIFLYNFSQFALIPFLGILTEMHPELFSAALIGFALTGKSITEKIGLFLNSVSSKELGTKSTLIIGLIGRALALFLIRFIYNPPVIISAVICIGVVGALIRPTVRAILNGHADERLKKNIFSLMFVSSNSGAIIGPLAVSLCKNPYEYLSFFTILALADLILAALTAIYLNDIQNKSAEESIKKLSFQEKFKNIYLSNRKLRAVYGLQFIFWFLVSMLIMVVSFLNKVAPSLSSLRGLIFAIEGGTVVILQLAFMSKNIKPIVEKYFNIKTSIIILFIGTYVMISSQQAYLLILAGILIGLGEGRIAPFIYEQLSKYSENNSAANTFSALLLFELIGEMAGFSLSGLLLNGASIALSYTILLLIILAGLMFIACKELDFGISK